MHSILEVPLLLRSGTIMRIKNSAQEGKSAYGIGKELLERIRDVAYPSDYYLKCFRWSRRKPQIVKGEI